MNQEKLDYAVDRVEGEFIARIIDLSDNEVEYLLEQLLSRFQMHMDRVQAGTR